jgi:hypothetical protein
MGLAAKNWGKNDEAFGYQVVTTSLLKKQEDKMAKCNNLSQNLMMNHIRKQVKPAFSMRY